MTANVTLSRSCFFLCLFLLVIPVVVVKSASAFGLTADDALTSWFVLLAAGLISAMVYFLSLRRIDQSVSEIKAAAEKYAGGHLTHRIPTNGSEFSASLAFGLNRMASQLVERIKEIEAQGRQVETILRSMSEGIIATDQNGRITKCNHAAAVLLHIPAERLVGRLLAESMRSQEMNDLVRGVIQSGKSENMPITWNADSGEHHLDAKVSPLSNTDGSPNGVVVVLSDITRLRKLEQSRKEFVANVSHELKTPLTSIKGFIETLLDGAMHEPEEAKRFCEIISLQVERLQAIIEDLLSLSRIEQESERGAIKLQRINLHDLLESAIDHVMPRAVEKRMAIHLLCPDDAEIDAHQNLLEQAVMNLLDNGIKYSDPGKEITVVVVPDADTCRIDIKDQGLGISPEHLDRIFERFYRVDKSRSRKQGGTGLGLSIVKHVVSAHGGVISVESIPGKGSTFTIRLPMTLSND